jgi:tetratricopeptide (TPR) repeat protein
LKEDIQRYLAGDAVEACPPTWSYQLSKYVRRHRSLLATAGVVAAMLVAATGVSLRYAWQAGEAAEAATLAKNEAISAQEQSKQHLRAALDAVDNLLKHASDEQLLKAPRLQPIVRNILDDSLAFYDRFEVTQGTTPEIRLRAANTRNQLAHLANQFSDLTQSERIYLETLQELRELYKENPGEDSFVHGLCHAEIRWGWFCLQKKKDAVMAANFFASAKQRIEQLSSSDPKNVQFRNDNLIDAINGLSFAYQNQGKPEQREQIVLEAYQQHGIVTSSFLILLGDKDPDLTAELWRRKLPEIRTEFAQSPSVGPVAKLISAAEFFRDYDRDQAIELYEDALESSAQLVIDYPQFNNSHEYFVRALKGATTTSRDQSQPVLSARDLLLLASRIPPSAEAIHLSLAAEMQRCANPIALLTSAIEINPRCPAYSIHRGAVLIELGRFEECLNDLNQDFEESSCAGPETYWYRSQIYLKLNELENSLEDLNRYVELDASHESLKQRGYFFMRYLRDNDRAIADFSAAITLRPTGHSLYQHRARAHVRAGNLESAKADFQKSFELNRREPNGTWWIDISWILKNGDEAFLEWMQDYLQRLVEANDRDTEFLQLHLQLALEREDFSQARADLAELKQSDETTARYRYWYYDALLAAHAGDLEQYREICADMLNEFGDVANVPALHLTAWSFALASDATDDYRDVIRLARRTLDNQIENPRYQTGLGAVYFRAGDYDAAKRHLMAALEAEKKSASRITSPAYAHYFLAMSHAALGEEEQATAELVKANQIASAELADSASFVRRSTLELLRKEAESLIGLIAK